LNIKTEIFSLPAVRGRQITDSLQVRVDSTHWQDSVNNDGFQ